MSQKPNRPAGGHGRAATTRGEFDPDDTTGGGRCPVVGGRP